MVGNLGDTDPGTGILFIPKFLGDVNKLTGKGLSQGHFLEFLSFVFTSFFHAVLFNSSPWPPMLHLWFKIS